VTAGPLRLLALVPYPPDRAPGQRYRIEQWQPRLEALGVHCELFPFEDDALYGIMERPGAWARKSASLAAAAWRRWDVLRHLDAWDAVFLHREAMILGPALIEPFVARRRPILFDFDDAIWMPRANPMNPLARFLKFQGKTAAIARMASAVLAGNRYLADWAGQFNDHVHVVPSTIETTGEYARTKTHRPTDRPTIGWSGSFSTIQYLIGLRPMLQTLRQSVPFSLRVICNGPPLAWPELDLEWRPWSSAREVDDLLDLDIGLMPQPDDAWTRGKCGMKALQYMALGIVPVTSRSGVLPAIIEDGVNGRLAGTTEEWIASLRALATDWTARAAMGARARATVEQGFSAAAHAPRVAGIVRDLVQRPRVAGG